ncbi:MAG: sialate O-acetylesterase [Akkermansiaceae bacterium]|nr:sialate O-acetylesterase [Akkermansiaceae bacterium]
MAISGFAFNTAIAAKPLKIYVLAGQSNMEGQAKIETFDYIGDDPATAPMLKDMRGPDGKPRVCERVWISYLTGSPDNGELGEGFGKLTAGYGSRGNPKQDGGKIGPEFTFGIHASKAYDGPILIIKTAWGGKSLNTDFRPPSAGPYEFNEAQLENLRKQGKDLAQAKADKAKETGRYYRLMVEHVRKVLADPKRVVPDFDAKAGYEIAGFVWFQGWNDMCDSGTYPDSNKPGGYAKYSEWMADFIRDIRKDLNAPRMPFVIGVIGVSGDKATGGLANIRPAMAAPAANPEFKGNVAAVETAPFWDYAMESLMGKKEEIDHRFEAAYLLDHDGVIEKPDASGPGWEPIGAPRPADRVWRFLSFDPQNKADQLPPAEKKRFRNVTLPAGLEQWYMPGFDDGKWSSGKAPIGKGVWKHRTIGNAVVKFKSDWGAGEFLLMRTTFSVDKLNYESYRLAVLARQGFDIYLNGHKIHTYVWWKDEPFYRPIDLEPRFVKYLKKGENVLAAYANVEYDPRTNEPHASIDLAIEGITKEGLANISSEEFIRKQMDKICTREEQQIIAGASNAGFHYLGSAKIMAQIGKACAAAMLEMEKK